MVNPKCFFAIAVTLLSAAPARAGDPFDYRVGDKVREDIVTPVPLMVVDPVATEALKEKESTRIPVVFRFNTNAAISIEDELRAAFKKANSNFLFLMHDSFHHTRLDDAAIASEQFGRLIASFKNRDKTFPLTFALAGQWARGESGLGAQSTIIARVREAMEQPIRQDNLTNAPKIGSRMRLVGVSRNDEPITLETAMQSVEDIPKTNMLTVSRARLALAARFPESEADYARYATRWLRPNSFVESELTLQARARHVEPLWIADNYLAGQTIATQGQVVDRKLMAAIGQLREKLAAGRLQEQVASQQTLVAQTRESYRWLIAGLGVVAAVLMLAIWRVARRKPATLMPATLSANVAIPHTGGGEVNPWEQRALEAEARAARAHKAIRQGVFAQLREKLVGALVSQRSTLIAAQESAAAEMAELERRLNELQSPLQDRLRAYESRIADLERALAARDSENKELIKAKIVLMRKQLEMERARNTLQHN